MEKRGHRGIIEEKTSINSLIEQNSYTRAREEVLHRQNPQKTRSQNSEKSLEKKLVSEVQRLGGLALKFWPVTFTGLPDRIILMPRGRVYFVELKSAGKKPTARQLKVHEQLRAMGFCVWTVDNEKELIRVIGIERSIAEVKRGA